VQGILLDLGVSSMQIDDPSRGFAYAQDAPLDMRMGRQELTAATILNTYSRAELASVLRRYGEERFADRIARRIVAERDREPFTTSGRLVQLLYDTIPMATRKTGGHPAKRTFQAIRIEVNRELDVLPGALDQAIEKTRPGGRVVALAYHSGEDRIVKDRFRHAATGGCTCPSGLPCVCGAVVTVRLIRSGAAKPTPIEVAANRRAGSARLRAVEKLASGQ
jgi:16S rRNA (cytosine1402-N4)-methyltransferase